MAVLSEAEWDIVEQKFVRGITREDGTIYFPTLKELAEEYGINPNTIYSTNDRKGWAEKKKKYKNAVYEKISEKKLELDSDRMLKTELLIEETAVLGVEVTNMYFKKIKGDMEHGKFVRGFDIKNSMQSLQMGLNILQSLAGTNINKVELNASQDIKLDITDSDFMNAEIEFAKKLINNKRKPE